MLRTLRSVIQANIVLFPVLIALNDLLFVVWLVGLNSGPFFTLVQSGRNSHYPSLKSCLLAEQMPGQAKKELGTKILCLRQKVRSPKRPQKKSEPAMNFPKQGFFKLE